jgi:hypothetical protein
MADTIREAIYVRLRDDDGTDPVPSGGQTIEQLLQVGADIDGFPAKEHIYHRSAPQDVEFPIITISLQSGITSYAFGDGPSSRMNNETWTIKGICRGLDSDPADRLDVRCFELLQDYELPVTGLETMWFRREEDVNYGEREEGAIIHHVGAMYRLLTEPA